MRRNILFALPLLLALVPATAFAHDDDYDDDNGSSSSDTYHQKKTEIGIALEASRSSQTMFGPGTTAGYLGMHGRFGRRVALGFGIEQGYGQDPSGWKRYDIAWNLPKLYMYLNPKSRTQLYVTTGMDMRVSHFDDGPNKPLPAATPWGFMYIGTFLGAGVEHRMDKSMSLRLEARWFVRGRTSGKAKPTDAPLDPEFNDATRGAQGAVVSLGLVFF
jgi:hypothetical protein